MQTLEPININALASLTLEKKYVMKVTKDDNTVYAKIWSFDTSDPLGKYSYSGEVDENDNLHGNGKITYYSNLTSKQYQGNFVNNQKSGEGIEIYINDDIYNGQFKSNKRNGYGKLYSNNGIIKYSGDWINDKITGTIVGYDYDVNGNKIYFGLMENGEYNGLGLKLKNDKIIQIGYYKNGIPEKKLDFNIDSANFELTYINSEDNENTIRDLYKKIQKDMTIANIELIQSHLVNVENITKLKVFYPESNYYEGDVKFTSDGITMDGNGKFVKHLQDKSCIELKGTFELNKFIDGNVYSVKGTNLYDLLFSGKFNKLDVNKICLHEDIYKTFTNGSINNKCKKNNNEKFTDLCFEGSLQNGRLSNGILYGLLPSGDKIKIYEGEFNSSVNSVSIGTFKSYHGYGTEYYQNGKTKYQGNFKHTKYHGNGVLFHEENGAIQYCGEFHSGEKHGSGMLYDSESNLVYEGMFTYDNIGSN